MAASATAAASTFALVTSLALPTYAAALRGTRGNRIAQHLATTGSPSGHHARPAHVADLTAFAMRGELPGMPVSLVSAVHPRARLPPTASARGPPGQPRDR